MLKRFLGLRTDPNRAIAETLYAQIVAAARQAHFYSRWDVPDTPLGRFEMLSLHVFLFLHRARGKEPALFDLAQVLTDDFFTDVDHSLRELGIGDMGIPKRMKKLARMFYGRAASYGEALESGDQAALAAALQRNVRPGVSAWPDARHLAAYVIEANRVLDGQSAQDLLAGRIAFPSASH